MKTASKRGRFFVFEGPDGSGKSTQAERITADLGQQGIPALCVRDPGGTDIGEQVRSVLLAPGNTDICIHTELLLYMASRSQLVEEVIRPALEASTTVICERYIYSSVVYQGFAGGLEIEDIIRIGNFATGSLVPDRVFLLDCGADRGLGRIRGSRDRMEQKDIEFHRKVRQGYLRIAEEYSDLFIPVDGTRPEDDVFKDLKKQIYNELQ